MENVSDRENTFFSSSLFYIRTEFGIVSIFDFRFSTDLNVLRFSEYNITRFHVCLSLCKTNFVEEELQVYCHNLSLMSQEIQNISYVNPTICIFHGRNYTSMTAIKLFIGQITFPSILSLTVIFPNFQIKQKMYLKYNISQ